MFVPARKQLELLATLLMNRVLVGSVLEDSEQNKRQNQHTFPSKVLIVNCVWHYSLRRITKQSMLFLNKEIYKSNKECKF